MSRIRSRNTKPSVR
ncbi:hypothetical protein, partial [Phocaeicola dorei]